MNVVAARTLTITAIVRSPVNMASKDVGIVVVGMGIAGKVRVRDLLAAEKAGDDLSLRLRGVVSRRTLSDLPEGVVQMSLEQALSRHDVQALAICTEPGSHEDCVRQGLAHGKHVLVEYPVALSSATAKELYHTASTKGLILHEEDIGLLTEDHVAMEEKSVISPITSLTITLQGSFNGWIEDFKKSGLPFVSNMSLLHAAYNLVGDMHAVSGHLEKSHSHYVATAKLSGVIGGEVCLRVERHSEGKGRDKQVLCQFADGELLDSKKLKSATGGPKKPGLFMEDLVHFDEKLHRKRKLEDDIKRSVRCLEIAEKIHKLMEHK